MSRRARHLNPYHAGAQVVFDARLITGIADSAIVSTWTGNPGTSVNATGTTDVSKPIYREAANGFNGQPAVQFDGSNDRLNIAALSLFQNVGSGVIIAAVSDSASGDATHNPVTWCSGASPARIALTTRNASSQVVTGGVRRLDADSYTQGGTVGSTAVPCIARVQADWSAGSVFAACSGVAGSAGSPSSGNTENTVSVGAQLGYNSFAGSVNRFVGKIGYVIAASPKFSDSVVKRLEHAMAFSFKIACS